MQISVSAITMNRGNSVMDKVQVFPASYDFAGAKWIGSPGVSGNELALSRKLLIIDITEAPFIVLI